MIVTDVSLNNFLSYESEKVTFAKGLNIVYGANAAGKTNLIDSIYLCSLGRSSRHSRDKELINWKAPAAGFGVELKVEKRFSTHTVAITADEQGKKRVTVDRLPVQRIGELMGVVNVVFFSPQVIGLVREAPADRRRFMDMGLCQQSKTYFYTLQRYNALLQQRNKLLKTYKGRASLDSMLEVVDSEMIRTAAFIIKERAKFIAKLKPYAVNEHYKLTDGAEEFSVSYETEAVDPDNPEEGLRRLAASSRSDDLRLEYTTVGPHRDDLKLSVSGVDLRKFGSQGQQRSAVLSLKLAEIASFRARTGETPVLLLDDVLSELDEKRRNALFNAIDGIQTIITCTEPAAFDGATYFEVKNGHCTRK